MAYATTLPADFKSWTALYDYIKETGQLREGMTTIEVVSNPQTVLSIRDDLNKPVRIECLTYSVRFLEESVLKELRQQVAENARDAFNVNELYMLLKSVLAYRSGQDISELKELEGKLDTLYKKVQKKRREDERSTARIG